MTQQNARPNIDEQVTQRTRETLTHFFGISGAMARDLGHTLGDLPLSTTEEAILQYTESQAEAATCRTIRDFYLKTRPHIAALHALLQSIEPIEDEGARQ